MRPKLIAPIAVIGLALTGCAATESDTASERSYLDSVHDSLEPIAEHVSGVTDENLLSAGNKACEGEDVPRFEESGIYHVALSNVIITSATVLCPDSQSYVNNR